MAELADTLTASEDERLDQAEALVRGFCGWHIAPSRTETVTLRGRGRSTLFLPSLYVTAVSSITDDGVEVQSSDYEVTTSGLLTRLDGCWGYNTDVVVTFTHGYTDVPADVTGVVQAIAQRSTFNPAGLKRETNGPFTEEFWDGAVSPGETDKLRSYRLPVMS